MNLFVVLKLCTANLSYCISIDPILPSSVFDTYKTKFSQYPTKVFPELLPGYKFEFNQVYLRTSFHNSWIACRLSVLLATRNLKLIPFRHHQFTYSKSLLSCEWWVRIHWELNVWALKVEKCLHLWIIPNRRYRVTVPT